VSKSLENEEEKYAGALVPSLLSISWIRLKIIRKEIDP